MENLEIFGGQYAKTLNDAINKFIEEKMKPDDRLNGSVDLTDDIDEKCLHFLSICFATTAAVMNWKTNMDFD